MSEDNGKSVNGSDSLIRRRAIAAFVQSCQVTAAGIWLEDGRAIHLRCPTTGLNVQHVFDDDEGTDTEDARVYVGVRCLACTDIHLVSRKNGRLISDKPDE